MSTVYNLEPPPTAKVVLYTTSGSLLLELFAQQTPLASRNFLQHCLDGYYDNTLFHRLVPGFVIQGGDPTGTGLGGTSSLDSGAPIQDEIHSRLKFNRRGLLGMASTGKDENASQFFLTLGKAEELTGRNTMFGRVEGETIFNLVKMGEAELVETEGGEASERPMFPTRITGAEVLVNPFEDMVRRVPQTVGRAIADKDKPKPKVKRKAAKGLLSFGGEDGDDGDVAPIVKSKFNPKAVDGGKDTPTLKRKAPETAAEWPRKRRATSSPPPSPPRAHESTADRPRKNVKAPSRESSPSPSPEPEVEAPKPSALERANAQIALLKKSLQRNTVATPIEAASKQSALQSMIPSTATRGRRRKPGGGGGSSALGGAASRDEQRALDSFNAFRKRLESTPAAIVRKDDNSDAKSAGSHAKSSGQVGTASVAPAQPGDDDVDGPDDEEATLCELHFVPNCQSCRKWDEDAEAEGKESDNELDRGWMSHRLTFEKDRLGKDLEWKRQNEKNLVVIDPREKAKEYKEERKRAKEKGRPT